MNYKRLSAIILCSAMTISTLLEGYRGRYHNAMVDAAVALLVIRVYELEEVTRWRNR